MLMQQDAMVKCGADIRRLLSRCMTLWQEGHVDIPIDAFQSSAKRFPKLPTDKMDKAHIKKYLIA